MVGTLARKAIDAIQNSTLDRLYVALATLAVVAMNLFVVIAISDRPSTEPIPRTLVVFGGFWMLLAIPAAAWMLGALANRRPGATARHRNGFEAWKELPAGGLRPPEAVAWLAERLSFGSRTRDGALELCIKLALMVPLLAFVAVSLAPERAAALSIATSWTESPTTLPLLLTLTLMAALRQWAVDVNSRLHGDNTPPDTHRAPHLIATMAIAAVIVAAFTVLFGAPLWLSAIVLLSICLLILIQGRKPESLRTLAGRRPNSVP